MALAAITNSGHAHALVVKGSVTDDVFQFFIIQLFQLDKNCCRSEQGVFHMDIALIHKPTEFRQLFGATQHILCLHLHTVLE